MRKNLAIAFTSLVVLFGAATFLGQNLTVWDNDPHTPSVWQWAFDMQEEAKGFLFDVAYVGSKGKHLNSPLPINALSPNYLTLGTGLQQLVTNPFNGIKLDRNECSRSFEQIKRAIG